MSTTQCNETQETTKYSLREANAARQAEWDVNGQITLAFRGNEIAGEVGEACNVIKKLERERMGIKGSRDTVAHLAEELADVVICADLIAMAAGIDLESAVRAKFNATSEKNELATRFSAPTSVEHAARFLLDRLQEFDPGDFEAEREFHGHVAPAIARLKSALSE